MRMQKILGGGGIVCSIVWGGGGVSCAFLWGGGCHCTNL